MTKGEFYKILERLRSEINALEGDDALVRERVNCLITDLEHQVENRGNAEHRRSIVDRLAELTERFETGHPSIAGMLEQIVATLGNIGI
ncbi:MAG: DUF4404 family protein [Thermoguttaceae bacterium]|jgi:hypothetical protein